MTNFAKRAPVPILTTGLALGLTFGLIACSSADNSEESSSTTPRPSTTKALGIPIIDQIGIYIYADGPGSVEKGDREYRTPDGTTQGYVYCEAGKLVVTLGKVNGLPVTDPPNSLAIEATNMELACFDDYLDVNEAREAVREILPEFITASVAQPS